VLIGGGVLLIAIGLIRDRGGEQSSTPSIPTPTQQAQPQQAQPQQAQPQQAQPANTQAAPAAPAAQQGGAGAAGRQAAPKPSLQRRTFANRFSIGVVIYECITGVHPCRRENEGATVHAILNEEPEPLGSYVADVPDGLERIIESAVSVAQEAREIRTDVDAEAAAQWLARIVMSASKKAEDRGPPRILVRAKSNIGPSGGGFGYHIDTAPLLEQPDIEATRIVWELPLEGNARELLAEAESVDEDAKTSKESEAKVFLKTALRNGERPQREIMAEAKANGIAEKTLRRAAKGATGKRQTALGWY